jgi:hypothetical protein
VEAMSTEERMATLSRAETMAVYGNAVTEVIQRQIPAKLG